MPWAHRLVEKNARRETQHNSFTNFAMVTSGQKNDFLPRIERSLRVALHACQAIFLARSSRCSKLALTESFCLTRTARPTRDSEGTDGHAQNYDFFFCGRESGAIWFVK